MIIRGLCHILQPFVKFFNVMAGRMQWKDGKNIVRFLNGIVFRDSPVKIRSDFLTVSDNLENSCFELCQKAPGIRMETPGAKVIGWFKDRSIEKGNHLYGTKRSVWVSNQNLTSVLPVSSLAPTK